MTESSSEKPEKTQFDYAIERIQQALAIVYHVQYRPHYIPTAQEMVSLRNLTAVALQMKNDIIEGCRQIEQRFNYAPDGQLFIEDQRGGDAHDGG